MRFDDEKTSGIWISFDGGRYHFSLPYPEYLRGTVCKDMFNRPIQPGDFLLLLFNADVLDSWHEIHPESVNALEDVLNDSLFTIAPELWGSTFAYSEKHAFLLGELLITRLYDMIRTPADENIELLGDGYSLIRAFSYMLIENKTMPDECRSLIQHQMPRVRFCFEDSKTMLQYYTRSIFELFAIDAYYFINHPHKFAFCKLCGRYFRKQERSTEAYCNYPNGYQGGMTCREYIKAHPGHKDVITELSRRAEKTQNKYCSNHPEKENQAEAYGFWAAELKKRTHEARVTRDIEPLKRFIRDTRFSKIGFSVTDYSVY